jgi:hypothetical protein
MLPRIMATAPTVKSAPISLQPVVLDKEITAV